MEEMGSGASSSSRQQKMLAQWPVEVTDFSSQYGSETSLSYTVGNLARESNIYPKYGDFTEACVFRTYGPWWTSCPSTAPPIGQRHTGFVSQDFVELLYGTAVYPDKIEILETFNPGAVVRILACDLSNKARWEVLWSSQPSSIPAPAEARVFLPPIITVNFPTKILRLELNHSSLDYYTELDAVRLYGRTVPPGDEVVQSSGAGDNLSSPCDNPPSYESAIADKPPTYDSLYTDSLVLGLSRLHVNDGLSAALDHSDNGYFDLLPEEVIQYIVKHLDVKSLCILASTSQLFHKHCYDPMQYTALNLQPHWAMICDKSLNDLASRCRHLQQLDLSWCGSHSLISPQIFTSFLESCGAELTILRLACCKFVENTVITTISKHCRLLAELDLQCNKSIDNTYSGLYQLTQLVNLKCLNLYRTNIDIYCLVIIIRSLPDLEVLNIGACNCINNFDDVARELGKHCKKLRCLDVWRARTLTEVGLYSLANNCPLLEELDVGWCSNLQSDSGCFVNLMENCHGLKKLFLTANRTVCDRDLLAVARCCPLMEQLDILGTREVKEETALRVLDCCKNLRMFDVSFCAGIDFATVYQWRQMYPHCSIKKSFQS